MADIRQITIAGVKVGLVRLDEALRQVSEESLASDEQRAERLLQLVSQSNYIPASRLEDYMRALIREYRRYVGEEVAEDTGGLEIRVLGPGCPRCDRLTSEVLAVLAVLELDADVEHVTDTTAIAGFGPLGMPALVINGKVVSSGRVPSRKEIEMYLREVSK